MEEKKSKHPEISMKNTKQEILASYNELLKKIKDKEDRELKPEKKIQEKKKEEVLSKVSDVSADSVVKNINNLKNETNKMLMQLSDKLELEVNKFNQIQEAINIKNEELKEIYEIDKSAATLAALIEAQHQEKQKFEDEMRIEKENLRNEIEATRDKWKKEREDYEAEKKELSLVETKKREREREEYKYSFQREQQLAKDKFEDEKAKLLAEKEIIEREMKELKEQTEKELLEREKIIAEREKECESWQVQVNEFPDKLELAVAEAVKDTKEKINLAAKYQQNLLEKQFEGEKNVLTVRIESLEKTVKEQNEQIAQLTKQQESAYQKVQDVAVKAIEGASKFGYFSGMQHTLSDQTKKQGGEE